jgi:hypothetical protein
MFQMLLFTNRAKVKTQCFKYFVNCFSKIQSLFPSLSKYFNFFSQMAQTTMLKYLFFPFKYFVTCFPSIWRYKTFFFFLALRVTSFSVKTPEKRAGNPNFIIGHAQWHILYYSSSAKCTGCACPRNHFRDFRSGPLPVTSLPVAHAHAITSGRSTTNVTWAVPIYYLRSYIFWTLWLLIIVRPSVTHWILLVWLHIAIMQVISYHMRDEAFLAFKEINQVRNARGNK